MNLDKSPLRVWILSDGRAGHYNQARGIVRALARFRAVEVDWVEMHLRAGLLRSLLRGLVNRRGGLRSIALLHLFYRFHLPATRPDLIVSAGGKTSFANTWLAQVLGVPNFYAGSLRRIHPECFTAVLTLEAGGDSARFLQVKLPPGAVDPEELVQAAARFRAATGEPAQRYWTLLLGGDGAGYRFREPDWQRLARLLQRLARQQGVRWLVVGSRRTGRRAQTLLQQNLSADSVQAMYWFGQDADFSMDAVLGLAERIMVTEDSMTMLAEAIYAQKPVHSLQPQQAAPTVRYERALQRFEAQGWLTRHAIAALLEDPQQLDHASCRPLQESPAIELGERLNARLGSR